jgi:hypothetical protein
VIEIPVPLKVIIKLGRSDPDANNSLTMLVGLLSGSKIGE